jgi:hypothetical protein
MSQIDQLAQLRVWDCLKSDQAALLRVWDYLTKSNVANGLSQLVARRTG